MTIMIVFVACILGVLLGKTLVEFEVHPGVFFIAGVGLVWGCFATDACVQTNMKLSNTCQATCQKNNNADRQFYDEEFCVCKGNTIYFRKANNLWSPNESDLAK